MRIGEVALSMLTCSLEMTHAKQSQERPFQGSGEQQAGQFSMQEISIFGSNFGTNQHPIL
jgi:hypothetical protein